MSHLLLGTILLGSLAYHISSFHLSSPTTVDPNNKNQKQINTRIKETCKSGTYNSELFFWACLFTPYLMKANGSRKIQPQPVNVKEDTQFHEIAARANESEQTGVSRYAKGFVKNCTEIWLKDRTPSTREHVDESFCAYSKQNVPALGSVPNPQEVLLCSGLLSNHEGKTRFKVKYGGKEVI